MSTSSIAVSQLMSCLAMLSAGTSYVFSLYGPLLQHLFNYSQSQTAFIAICGNAGVFLLGPFWGFLCDTYPNNTTSFFGIGGSMIALGYYYMSVLVTNGLVDVNPETGESLLPSPHFLLLAFLNFLVGSGSSAVYHCSLSTNYRNWPSAYRSVAIGLSVSFFGLSAFIFANVGFTFFVTKGVLQVDSFLQLLAFGCFGINLLSMAFLHPIKDRVHSPELRPFAMSPSASLPFIRGGTPSPVAAVVLEETLPLLLEEQATTFGVEQDFDEYQEDIEEALATPGVDRIDYIPPPPPLLHESNLGSLPLLVTSNEQTPLLAREEGSRRASLDDLEESLQLPPSSQLQPIVIHLDDVPYFTSFDAYLLAYIMFTLAGCGLMYINNVGSIVLSLFPQDVNAKDPSVQKTISAHVQFLSIGSFLARIIFGVLSDFAFTFAGLKKSFWAVVCCLAMLAGQLNVVFLAPVTLDRLFATTFLVAISYGGVFTVLPILVGLFFGLKNFSRNWGWMTVVPAIGGQFFSYIFGFEYDLATGANDRCLDGVRCFQKVFDGAAIMTVFAMMAAVLLVFKRKI